MTQLTEMEMVGIDGGGWTWCGIGVGALLGASMLYGAIGFAMVVNKAGVACGLSAAL